MIRILFKTLIIAFLITAIIGVVGYFRSKELQKPGTVAPYADNVNIFIVSQAKDFLIDRITEISENRSVQYAQSFDDRDIGIYLVKDWNTLSKWGLLKYCGELCTGTKHLNLNRKIELKNFAVLKKDLFLNLSDFSTLKPDGTSFTASPADLDCLKQVLEREIRYLIPPGDTVLKCQKDLTREKHDGILTTTNHNKFSVTLGW